MGYDNTRSVREIQDGTFIVAGGADSFGAGDRDFWLLKLDSAGSIGSCPLEGISTALVTDTAATVIDTNVAPITSTAIVTNTNATVTNTTATPLSVCSVPVRTGPSENRGYQKKTGRWNHYKPRWSYRLPRCLRNII